MTVMMVVGIATTQYYIIYYYKVYWRSYNAAAVWCVEATGDSWSFPYRFANARATRTVYTAYYFPTSYDGGPDDVDDDDHRHHHLHPAIDASTASSTNAANTFTQCGSPGPIPPVILSRSLPSAGGPTAFPSLTLATARNKRGRSHTMRTRKRRSHTHTRTSTHKWNNIIILLLLLSSIL